MFWSIFKVYARVLKAKSCHFFSNRYVRGTILTTERYSMINYLLLLGCFSTALSATSPVVSRYLPSHTCPEVAMRESVRPSVSVAMSAAHAAKTFGQDVTKSYTHQFDGLLEIGGRYDLHGLINAAHETITGYTPPFVVKLVVMHGCIRDLSLRQRAVFQRMECILESRFL